VEKAVSWRYDTREKGTHFLPFTFKNFLLYSVIHHGF
jgi:hypothetical protein